MRARCYNCSQALNGVAIYPHLSLRECINCFTLRRETFNKMPESIEEVDAPLGLGMLDADPDRQKFLLECMWNEETGFETLQ